MNYYFGGYPIEIFMQLEEFAVYRLFGAGEELLYVGCSKQLKRRLGQHKKKPWFRSVRRIEFEIVHLERIYIMHAAPLFNRVANIRRGWRYSAGNAGLAYFPERDEFAQVAA